jgi:hypothetical protein
MFFSRFRRAGLRRHANHFATDDFACQQQSMPDVRTI